MVMKTVMKAKAVMRTAAVRKVRRLRKARRVRRVRRVKRERKVMSGRRQRMSRKWRSLTHRVGARHRQVSRLKGPSLLRPSCKQRSMGWECQAWNMSKVGTHGLLVALPLHLSLRVPYTVWLTVSASSNGDMFPAENSNLVALNTGPRAHSQPPPQREGMAAGSRSRHTHRQQEAESAFALAQMARTQQQVMSLSWSQRRNRCRCRHTACGFWRQPVC